MKTSQKPEFHLTAEQLQRYDRTVQIIDLQRKLEQLNIRLAKVPDEVDRMIKLRQLLIKTITLAKEESK